MLIENYYKDDNGSILVSRQQASDFAKSIAGDFNPIHNADAKRFCVPGDLLFSLVLHKYGLSQKMNFTFAGMVGDGVNLLFPEQANGQIDINDDNGKNYLRVEREGETSNEAQLINQLTKRYVAFSGQTFPHILVPLMADNKVMINPSRPMVIYESMAIDMQRLDISDPDLLLANSTLDVEGKRGIATLHFNIMEGDELVGSGKKTMILSGLREFDKTSIDELVEDYESWKQGYHS